MKKFLLSLFLLGMTLIPNCVSAEKQVIEADGEYHLGDYENVSVGRERAKEDALRNASMKGSVFIKSILKSIDNILAEDEIFLVTSNVLQLQDSKTKNDTTSDEESIVIRCHVIVLVDSDNVKNLLGNTPELDQVLRDKKQIEDERNRLAQEVEYWKNKYKTAANDSEREKAVKEIQNNDDSFTATQHYARGCALQNEKKYTEAIDEYSKAIELNPNNADVYLNRGSVYHELQKYNEAIRDYTRVLELDSNYAYAYNNRGNAYKNLGKYDDAIRDYTCAVELKPNYAIAYGNLGHLYFKLEKYSEAIQSYNKAIELIPNFTELYYSRGVSYSYLGKYDEAIRDFDKAIELNPNFWQAYYWKGVTYQNSERYDEAIKNFQKSLSINPNYQPAKDRLEDLQNRRKSA